MEARGVVKRFAGHTALDGVSVEVRPGRVFGLLGPNGAGKTTLIRIINRITMPDEGEVLVHGRATSNADPIGLRRNIGYAIQGSVLFISLFVSLMNLLVDLIYGFVDPRIKAQYGSRKKKQPHKAEQPDLKEEEVA